MHRYPFETSTNAEIVTVLNQSVGRAIGKPPAYIGHSWWEDSALLAEEGMDTVIIGPKGAGLHTHEEWVDVQSVIDLTRILVETIVEFCA